MYYLVYDHRGKFQAALELGNDKEFAKWNETTPKKDLHGLSIRVFTDNRNTTYGQFSELKVANQRQVKSVIEAYLYAKKLSGAKIDKDGGTTCGTYHIEPFNTSWDRDTVEGVSRAVKIYVDTWVVDSMIDFFNSIYPAAK